MRIELPERCLVLLIGPSGCGKSTFAARHFLPTEVVSSDGCRGMISDDANDQSVTSEAFDLLQVIAGKRLAARRLTVIDATNVQKASRAPLIALAREHDLFPVAIVLDTPAATCVARNRERPDRTFGPHVVRAQLRDLDRGRRGLKREGLRRVFTVTPDDLEAVEIVREPMWTDREANAGPFDIVGDVHGCFEELVTLLRELGWEVDATPEAPSARHPEGRQLVFVGDLVDRGPASPAVLRLAMQMCADGVAHAVPGNHDAKLLRKLDGKNVKLSHGLDVTMAQLEGEPEAFIEAVRGFLRGLVSHLCFDGGQLVVAHAGIKQRYIGRASGRVRAFCLFGETTGHKDERGLPERLDWAADYRGPAHVVYGHTPTAAPEWRNRTLCLDTGCVFGGELTALRWPERELIRVPARFTYAEPARPLTRTAGSARPVDALELDDVAGKRSIETRLRGRITVRAENAAAALEVISRFAIDPRWCVYLPPTMAPAPTCREGALLERPREALAYAHEQGVRQLVCQEKHMGSRAVLVVCRHREAAARRFACDGRQGVVYTRSGRPFFREPELEAALIARVAGALERAGWWDELASDWLVLDAELMPWSAKARELLRRQYAAVGAAGRHGLGAALTLLERSQSEGVEPLREQVRQRLVQLERFTAAYRPYCWTTDGIDGLRLAPFALLASEGRVHDDRGHVAQMETLATLCEADPELLQATRYLPLELGDALDDATVARATAWWQTLLDDGGEGMVIKPDAWAFRGKKGLALPAQKVRGPEYLRLIYGPEYDTPAYLERLRQRGLGRKRSRAVREYALSVEGLHHLADGEPLYRVHQCAFAVLALESEPADPRL